MSYLLIFPCFPDNFGTCGEWESNFEGCQMKVLDSVFLPANTGTGSVEEHSVLVDDVDNSGDLTGLGSILEDDDSANFYESLERLKKH